LKGKDPNVLGSAITREWRDVLERDGPCQICGLVFMDQEADKRWATWVTWQSGAQQKSWGPLCMDREGKKGGCAKPVNSQVAMASALVKPTKWEAKVDTPCSVCELTVPNGASATMLYMTGSRCNQGPLCTTCRTELFDAYVPGPDAGDSGAEEEVEGNKDREDLQTQQYGSEEGAEAGPTPDLPPPAPTPPPPTPEQINTPKQRADLEMTKEEYKLEQDRQRRLEKCTETRKDAYRERELQDAARCRQERELEWEREQETRKKDGK